MASIGEADRKTKRTMEGENGQNVSVEEEKGKDASVEEIRCSMKRPWMFWRKKQGRMLHRMDPRNWILPWRKPDRSFQSKHKSVIFLPEDPELDDSVEERGQPLAAKLA
jgi:hypothetical protein